MKVATLLGILLVALGVFGLARGGFSFTSREKVVDAGPIEISADRERSIPVSPILGGLAVVAGIGLIVAGTRGRRV
jgi:hypothetical protein